MGGSSAKPTFKGGDLFIQLPQMTQVAGELVHGTIFLNMLKQYPGRVLEILIEGNEKT